MRFKNAADIKYYLYRSKPKVESLFVQIAHSGQVTTSGGLSAFGLGLNRSSADLPDDDDKLKAVSERLEYDGRVGSIESPNEYIRGVTSMKWGLYKDVGRPEEEPPLVYFGAQQEGVVIGLGGSSRNVENVYGCSATGSRSVTPALVLHLVEGLGLSLEGWRTWGQSEDYGYVFEAMYLATEHLKGIRQNVEFLAKVLIEGRTRTPYREEEELRFILGTPLYVALAPPLPEELSDY